MPELKVFAPADGKLIPLAQVPDPAFSEKMLGDGVAVAPSCGFTAAPFDGKVLSVHHALHAVVLGNGDTEVLIHVGVETVGLQGKGFKALVKDGDEVKRGQKLTEFDPDFLAANVPCNWVIMVVTSPDGAELNKASLSEVKAGQDAVFSLTVKGNEEKDSSAAPRQWIYSRPVTIVNPNGLHARPAAKLAEEAKKYTFAMEIEFNGQTADAKSLVAIMGLSLAKGHEIRLRADSADGADEALRTLADLVESGLGETPDEPAACPAEDPCLCNLNDPVDLTHNAALKALTACSGMARGKVWQYSQNDVVFDENSENPAEERLRLKEALDKIISECEMTARSGGKDAREIALAHAELLKDPFLSERAFALTDEGKTAAYAFNEAVRASIDVLKKTKNRFLMERIADLKDLRRRILQSLSGKADAPLQFPQDCIVVAEELLPSDLARLDGRVKGVLLAFSSPTAHASILLRNMGLPSLVGAGACVLDIADGTEIILNASDGNAVIHPTEEQIQKADSLIAQEQAEREQSRQTAGEPALTRDGVRIMVEGNAGNEREAIAAFENGADGLGLVRTEFLFFQSDVPPSEEKQYMQYQNIAGALQGKSVTLRTLDVGGDKPVQYMPLPQEDNPIVGLRGVRNYERYRDLFRSQIRAMLRVTPTGCSRIMLPMVAFVDELLEYKHLIEEEKKNLGITAPVKVGVMVEVPSAALTAKQLAKHADFFSLGTNDLTQYTLAIDRGHKTLCAKADSLHPAVLDLIASTCEGARAYGRPVAVCGAMAGDLQAVPLLIGLGVTELAVGAGAVAQVKALVRKLDKAHCAEIANKARTFDNATQVRELVKKEFAV